MSHERLSTVVISGLTLTAILFVGILIGKGGDRAGYASEPYEELQVFAEVLSQVKKHYVEETNTKDLIQGALRGMLAGLDPHSSFMTPDMFKEMQVETKGEFGGLGIQIGIKNNRLTVISPIEDTPAFEAGIQPGDTIVKVDDKPTKDLTLMEAVQQMRGPRGTTVQLTIEREGLENPLVFTIKRDIIKIQSVRSKLLEGNVGYVRLSQFQEATAEDLTTELEKLVSKDIQGLIIDLRNNPGGLLTAAVGVSEQFLDSGRLVVSIQGRNGKKDEYRARANSKNYQYPMIVLVNHGSASASEIVAAAMQDWGKAVVIGTTTFGKGSVQTILPLSDGSGLRLTTAKYYTPKGKSIHSIGVQPDIVIDPKPAQVAKQETPEGKKDGNSENQQAPSAAKSSASPPPANSTPKDKDQPQPVPPEDVQLLKAVEMLKSWKVFKQLRPAA
ncbi:MAG: S41 family peptidase [Nitrospirota bacterium]|nr:S41 family peptidase [Nitrospirota bacterium]MDH4359182.1 S41 family peptidase [Nitrospirota bacterium]MDH5574025.1 S41 family peptidase [Nitrospirota bacterium]